MTAILPRRAEARLGSVRVPQRLETVTLERMLGNAVVERPVRYQCDKSAGDCDNRSIGDRSGVVHTMMLTMNRIQIQSDRVKAAFRPLVENWGR
jgi:hypothetical protein